MTPDIGVPTALFTGRIDAGKPERWPPGASGAGGRPEMSRIRITGYARTSAMPRPTPDPAPNHVTVVHDRERRAIQRP